MADQWFSAAIEGNLIEVMAAEREALSKATTAGLKQAASLLQNNYRRQVRAAGLGEGLEKAWRTNHYPSKGHSLGFAALVFSKSRRIHMAFSKNTTIRAAKSDALIIPTPLAEALGLTSSLAMSMGNRPRKWFSTPTAEYKYGPLWTIEGKRGGRILMGKVNGQPKALGWLVRQVRLKKRLDLQGPADQFKSKIPTYIANHFARMERIKSKGFTQVFFEAA
jgi:hypothetical protein